MAFCTNCGTQLGDNAKFCLKTAGSRWELEPQQRPTIRLRRPFSRLNTTSKVTTCRSLAYTFRRARNYTPKPARWSISRSMSSGKLAWLGNRWGQAHRCFEAEAHG